MNMKKLPVGIEDFREIINENFYYVDKTAFIADLLAGWTKVNLFTRPRRFGKSLNMSMLKSFFELDGDKHIFDGLKIRENAKICDAYMGQFPVVSVSLKGVNGTNFEEAYEQLRIIIRNEARRLHVLRSSPALTAEEQDTYIKLTGDNARPSGIAESLQLLCVLLEKHYGRKVILLIDEYDVPLDKAYANQYYPQMIHLIRAMFNAALKSNDSLYFAVLTGCLRVSKESIFTGFNNLKVHSISDERFDEYFGFTDAEVRRMLSAYGLDGHYEEIHAWYDGYRFGGQHVYCPWDVINYCYDLLTSSHAQPKAYWLNTSGNDMVRELIDKSAGIGTARKEIERLIAGETITKPVNEQLTHSEINKSINNIWSLLYMTGYLTTADYPEGNLYQLRIPNREILEIYKTQVLEWFQDKASAEPDRLTELYRAFEACDTQKIEALMHEQLRYTVSFHDAYESFYHGFLLALLCNCDSWIVRSNWESGNGRSDILVEGDDSELGFVIEIKAVKTEASLEKACDDAVQQIEDRNYADALRADEIREIAAYGIAFCDKKCRVKVKRIC